jgi:hypothetical protein
MKAGRGLNIREGQRTVRSRYKLLRKIGLRTLGGKQGAAKKYIYNVKKKSSVKRKKQHST